MPDRLNLGRGGFSPVEVAKAYREEHPRMFDDLDDGELMKALETEDPETFQLVDPLLIGSEILPHYTKAMPPGPPGPLPTYPLKHSFVDTAIETGLNVVPTIGGALLGSSVGPWGTAAGGFAGGGVGSAASQYYQKHFGNREEYSPGAMAFDAALGALNPGARGATLLGRTASQVGFGSAIGGAGTVGHSYIETGGPPSATDVATGMALGGAFGGVTHGAFEGYANIRGRAPSFGDATGALPTDIPPSPLSPADQLIMAQMADQMYQQEEARLLGELRRLYGPDAVPGARSDAHTALQAKDYLEQLATLGKIVPTAIPPIQPGLEATPYAPPPPQGLLEPGQFTPDPNQIDTIPGGGPPGRTIVAGGGPPALAERLGGQLESSLQEPPGPPRLLPKQFQLRREGVPRGMAEPGAPPELIDRPTVSQEGPVRQGARMGGRPATPEQPRIPGTAEPTSIDREYASGPNAGPRRKGELHGEPRMTRRRLQVGKTFRFEQAPSELHAEDPGTYPAEVRREMARMLYELQEHPYERIGGGSTQGQLAELKIETGDISSAIGEAKRRGATSGGAISGAPVYHEILTAAKGARAHATRQEVLADLRAALLEGKGTTISDAAAQVARGRLTQVAEGRRGGVFTRRSGHGGKGAPVITTKEGHAIISEPGAGDSIIGWVDEAGMQALPEQDLSEFERSAREATDGELLGSMRIAAEGPINPEVQEYFDAAQNEAVRRGLIRPAQPGLPMEGPGGAKGPSLLDFEGGEPPPGPTGRAAKDLAYSGPERRSQIMGAPTGVSERRHAELLRKFGGGTEAERRALAPPPPARPAPPTGQGLQEFEPALPELEGVRAEDRPLPPVAEVPFSLAAPPPGKPRVGERTLAERPPLLRRLLEEEGVLILDIPSGDRQGLRKWLKRQEEEHGGSPWFSRVEQHMEEGNWDKAWKTAASASVRSYSAAFQAAKTPQQERLLAQAVKGTPLQEDINAQLVAQGRQESGLGTAPPVKDFPPSGIVSQAGAARGKATIGPAGIINPGRIQRPLKPSQRAHTLPRTFVDTLIEETDPELIHIIPGNEDTSLRLYRQIADLAFAGTNTRELKQYLHLSDQEIGQHAIEAVQEAARILQRLSAFRQTNEETLTRVAEQMSMGGALRGMLGSGRVIVGKRGQVVGATGSTMDAQATLDVLATDTASFDQAMLANTLQRPRKASELELLQAASYPFMLMRWRTAVRNMMSTAGRYTVDALDDALTIPLAKLLGDEAGASLAKATAAEKLTLKGKYGATVTPRTAWKATLQDIYDFGQATIGQLDPSDARHTINLLTKVPEHEAHFLGAMAGGEEFHEGGSRFKLLNAILDPKLQRVLTVFNRAQEFSGRGIVFDATMRAQLRAAGHTPDVLLQQPYEDIVTAVGGAQAFDNLVYNATAAALESTFSGQAARGSIPGALLHAVNTMWPLKLGYPFPKFNIVAAPRWIYDHSPAALMELIRFPLDTIGLTSGEFAGGRLYRGVRAQRIQKTALPELAGKRQEAIGRLGAAQREYLATSREMGVRTRQVRRLEARGDQPRLPEGRTTLQAAQEAREQLGRRRSQVQERMTLERDRIRKLKAQEDKLLDVVRDAQGINAPTIPQYIARMTSGAAILGAAAVIRAQPEAEGTRWYEYRYDKGDGSDPDILDFRPYAPFAQYLMVADAMQDITRFTDWQAAHAQAPADGWTRATWDNYEGKYTSDEMKAQLAQAFLSISRVGGTTLTLTDLMTQNGWPGPQDAGDAIVGTIGQFLSRFYTGFGDIKDVAAGFSEEEAKVRIPPRATAEEWTRPLAAPLSQVPGVSRLIPERISQTTGKAVTTTHPWLRALAGIGSAPRDFVTEEVRRVGVPGQSVFIRETGDYGLDKMVAENYARILQQELPAVLEDQSYIELRTPARQRDFLQRYIFPPLKRAALGETREALGESRFTEATVVGEEARRRQRQQKMLEDLIGETPESQLPGDQDLAGQPPPGPPPSPAPAADTLGGPPPGP